MAQLGSELAIPELGELAASAALAGSEGARVRVYDPVVKGAELGEQVEFFDSNYEAAKGAHGLALCTEWHEFRRPNFKRLRELLLEPVLFDGRNVWDPEEVRGLGFRYYGIGRR